LSNEIERFCGRNQSTRIITNEKTSVVKASFPTISRSRVTISGATYFSVPFRAEVTNHQILKLGSDKSQHQVYHWKEYCEFF
jgi:hypothetical protein